MVSELVGATPEHQEAEEFVRRTLCGVMDYVEENQITDEVFLCEEIAGVKIYDPELCLNTSLLPQREKGSFLQIPPSEYEQAIRQAIQGCSFQAQTPKDLFPMPGGGRTATFERKSVTRRLALVQKNVFPNESRDPSITEWYVKYSPI